MTGIDWNIPKHLAKFEWTTNADKSLTVAIYPYVTPQEVVPSTKPFFTMTFKPFKYLPAFPFSLTSMGPLLKTEIVLPPLPAHPQNEELCGTERWCHADPKLGSWKTRLGWFDMQQKREEGVEREESEFENFFPGWGRWQVGFAMEDATLGFSEPATWAPEDMKPFDE